MDENDPVVPRPRRRNSLPYQAAKIGVTIPVIGLVGGAVLRSSAGKIDWQSVLNTGIYPLGLVETAACAMGVLFALIALFGIPAGGTQGLLLPGAAGLVMSAGLLALAVLQLRQQEWHSSQAAAIAAAEEQLEQAMFERYLQKRDTAMALGDVANLVSEVGDADLPAAKKAMLLEISSEISRDIRARIAAYKPVVEEFTKARLMDVPSIETQADIARRKLKAEEFLKSATEFRDYVGDLETRVRKLVADSKIDDETGEYFMGVFLRNSQANRETVWQIREQDVRVAQVAVDLLNLLDSSWGEWIYDPDDQTTVFDSKDLADQFHELTRELTDATAEFLRLQKQLVDRN